MKTGYLALMVAGSVLTLAQAAVAHGPPAGVTTGPPSFVTMGPPAGVLHGPPAAAQTHIPAGLALGQANAANELGKLNAAHASPIALQHAAPNSAVGMIASYESQMNSALALTDPTARDAAITTARQQLAAASNKKLTPSAVTRLDGTLGIVGASPTLGTTP